MFDMNAFKVGDKLLWGYNSVSFYEFCKIIETDLTNPNCCFRISFEDGVNRWFSKSEFKQQFRLNLCRLKLDELPF